jgi:hypothetical protein
MPLLRSEAEAKLGRSEHGSVAWQREEVLDHVKLVSAAARKRSVPRTGTDTSPDNYRCRMTSQSLDSSGPCAAATLFALDDQCRS